MSWGGVDACIHIALWRAADGEFHPAWRAAEESGSESAIRNNSWFVDLVPHRLRLCRRGVRSNCLHDMYLIHRSGVRGASHKVPDWGRYLSSSSPIHYPLSSAKKLITIHREGCVEWFAGRARLLRTRMSASTSTMYFRRVAKVIHTTQKCGAFVHSAVGSTAHHQRTTVLATGRFEMAAFWQLL